MGATDDRQAIETLIREFLDAAAQARFPPDFWAQPLSGAFAIGTEIGRSTPIPLPVLSGSAHVRKLEIQSIEGDTARVDLNAECVTKVDHPIAGHRYIKRLYHGGVLLHRETGSWRIATLKQDGVDFAAAAFEPVVARANVDGVDVSVTARSGKGEWFLGLLVRNRGPESAVVERVEMAHPKVWWLFEDGFVFRQRPLVLRRDASWGIFQAVKGRIFLRPMSARARINGNEVAVELTPPRIPFVRRIRHCAHPNAILHFFVVISLLLIPVAPRSVGALGLALLLAGALNVVTEALAYARASHFSAQWLYGAVGVLELALGAFLVRREQVNVITIVGLLAFVAYLLWLQVRSLELWRKAQAETVRDAAT